MYNLFAKLSRKTQRHKKNKTNFGFLSVYKFIL